MKTSNVVILVLMAFAVGFGLGLLVARKYRPAINLPVQTIVRDTVIVRDTIIGEVPPPQKVEVVRVDTYRFEQGPFDKGYKAIDTVPRQDTAIKQAPDGSLLIPIERKTFAGDNYYAVISGWRPSLDSVAVYCDTRTITNTVTRIAQPKVALIGGGGVGYTTDKKIVPFLGLSL